MNTHTESDTPNKGIDLTVSPIKMMCYNMSKRRAMFFLSVCLSSLLVIPSLRVWSPPEEITNKIRRARPYLLVDIDSVFCNGASTDPVPDGIRRVSSPRYSSPLVLSVESKYTELGPRRSHADLAR